MHLMRRWIRRSKAFVGSMSLRLRLGAALLAALAGGGGLWLVCQSSSPQLAPVLNEPMDGTDLNAAVGLLQAHGIAAKVVNGKLMTDRDLTVKARGVLAYEGVLPRNLTSTFDDLAGKSDIFSTSDQNDKRWQAAKMTILSKLIGTLPPVRSATVLYEPGQPRRLGGGASEPTAAVKVDLKPNATVDRKLVVAIADLVAGSITNMNRHNIRIVDSNGKSYTAGEDGKITAADLLDQQQAAETFYCQKITSALRYIDNAIISVQVESGEVTAKCVGATVAVPRSYLAAIWRSSRAGASEASDSELDSFAASQMTRIGQSAMQACGLQDPAAVKVEWYYDVPTQTPAPSPAKAATWWLSGTSVAASAWCLSGLAMAGGLALLWMRRIRRRRMESQDELAGNAFGDEEASANGPFGFLADIPEDELQDFLEAEHPQTVALILAHLDSAKSAGILAGLSPSRQIEVARRIAEMERIDPQVIAEVQSSVMERLDNLPTRPSRPAGLATVARILHHTDQATERAVLDGLSNHEPTLVQSIRQRMFAFEDIAMVPPMRLRSALDNFDSEELAVALRTAGDELRDKVLASLSPASVQRVREEIDRVGPVRLSDVEAAQQHVAEAVRRMASGQYLSESPSASELLA